MMMMRVRHLLSVACSLAFALQCFAVGTSSAASTFEVGAQWTDMTPEPFDAAAHVPDLDVPGFDGPRQWNFQEPYIDLNGNAYWDPGEPYLDVNPHLRYDGMYPGRGAAPAFPAADQ